jgi:hypothetical protein
LIESELSLWQLTMLRLFGYVEVGVKQDTYGVTKLYVFRCEKHGLQTDTPHGYEGKLFCPLCDLGDRRVRLEASP